ncbi:PadR family transcriptional regulator [Rathayibacter rathayi]|uniref:PadR family transcriptional regulator n=1 Tax=Rathayibacter rathayi TaxID=33887 RepID=UPI001324C9E8|nr:PadR family transcriptional regulator [Rathayibacter rathayi]MWV75846.1 hypothetical protein [Rathayibacter rathayi NCPPB 2980 = VKM Ac-1601]
MRPRLTRNLAFLTAELARKPHNRWGYELTKATGIPTGVLYPLLHRLLVAGWLNEYPEDTLTAHLAGRPPRNYLSLTPLGATEAAELHRRIEKSPRLRALMTPRGAETSPSRPAYVSITNDSTGWYAAARCDTHDWATAPRRFARDGRREPPARAETEAREQMWRLVTEHHSATTGHAEGASLTNGSC